MFKFFMNNKMTVRKMILFKLVKDRLKELSLSSFLDLKKNCKVFLIEVNNQTHQKVCSQNIKK